MKSGGWLWFGGIQMAGICLCLISTPSLFRDVGLFLLLPGSLLPWLQTESLNEPPVASRGIAYQVLLLVGIIIVNALSWRSTARILKE
jgi:hypothetical protein